MPTPSKFSRNPVLVALGKSVRAQRIALGLSQEELAQRASLDRSYVGQVERGENSVSVLTLKSIADALGTTVAELMRQASL